MVLTKAYSACRFADTVVQQFGALHSVVNFDDAASTAIEHRITY